MKESCQGRYELMDEKFDYSNISCKVVVSEHHIVRRLPGEECE